MGSDTILLKKLRQSTLLSEQSYTRPADTTAYQDGDVVANSTTTATILTFTGMAKQVGGGGTIVSALLIDSVSATVKPEFELYLFDTAPTMQQDNAAWAPSDAEMEKCLGYLQFQAGNWRTGTSSGNGLILCREGLSYQCAAAQTSLFGICVARNAYVPANAEKFTFRLVYLPD